MRRAILWTLMSLLPLSMSFKTAYGVTLMGDRSLEQAFSNVAYSYSFLVLDELIVAQEEYESLRERYDETVMDDYLFSMYETLFLMIERRMARIEDKLQEGGLRLDQLDQYSREIQEVRDLLIEL